MNLFSFWFIVCDFRCWCGNPVKIITDPIGDLVEDVVDVTETVIKDTVDILEEAVDLVVNVTEGTLDNMEMTVHGVLTQDWTEIRDGTIGTTTTALYVTALVIGISTGNAWLIAASVAALDGQHNEGQLTHKTVQMIAHLETGILGTEIISRNADYIEMAIILAGSIYAGGQGFIFLAELAGIQSYLAAWNIAMGLNSSYEAYQQYDYWKGYYQEKMAEYQAWIDGQLAMAEQMKAQWFDVYGDISNSEVLYEAMPGGYLFNAGAGSDEYSVSSIHEQGALILSIDTKKDIDMDKQMHDISKIDYVRLGLNEIEPKATTWA